METDPGESTNLWSEYPDVVEVMAAELARLQSETHTRPY